MKYRKIKGWVEYGWADEDAQPIGQATTVYEEDIPEEEFTGLVDADGEPIYRINDKKIGYIWRDE